MMNCITKRTLNHLKRVISISNFKYSSIKESNKKSTKGPQGRHQNKQPGSDDYGTNYANIEEMWKLELQKNHSNRVVNQVGSKERWYKHGADHWKSSEATYSGVLGGYPEVNKFDIPESEEFLTELIFKGEVETNRAIDCGAGIGRISKQLLCKKFREVDLVDQNPNYVAEARNLLKDEANMKHFYVNGLQDFEFEKEYDCIWIQWVAGQLIDEDFVNFLKRGAKSLTPKGIIFVKENVTDNGFLVHKSDFSVTRSDELFQSLFAQAGLELIKAEFQKEFPKDFHKVCQYALRNAA